MIFLANSTVGGSRPTPLQELYRKISELQDKTDGPYYLSDCTGHQNWPERGIYIFLTKDSQPETYPQTEMSVARVGTVGVATGSSNSLWNRLRQHRGNTRGHHEGGGNHRGSIFRLHVGRSIIEKENLHDKYPFWGQKHSQWPDDVETKAVREMEHPLEKRVSDHIRSLPFLVLAVPGDAGPQSDRASIEKRLISTFSFYRRSHANLIDGDRLTNHSPKPEVYKTGMWNIDHVEGFSSPSVAKDLDKYIEMTEPVDTDNTD